jgi:hypothetical protein
MASDEQSTFLRESERSADSEPIACDISAIPDDQRATHFALARSLFSGAIAVREVDAGVAFELRPDRLAAVAAFVENERRCCRHLAFALEIPPRYGAITLRVSGPGAREEMAALLPLGTLSGVA